MKQQNKGRFPKRGVLIAVCCILAILLVALIALMIWWKGFFGRINRVDGTVDTLSSEQIGSILEETDPMDPDFTGPVLDPDDATMPTDPVGAVPVGENVINILLVGQDRREGQSRQRSDSMILCTINKSAKTLTMTSFLRDTWIRIPGKYDERLNVPYAIGGFDLLNETLEYNFGVSADHSIEVDFSGFESIIDLVGGVDVKLTAAEANHLNKVYGWSLTEGVNGLNGAQALGYARIRKLDNDFGRTNRQRTVLTSLLAKAKTLELKQMYKLVEGILPMITTDMSDGDILSYAMEIAPLLSELTIVSQRIPADGAYAFARIDGKSVLYLSPDNLEKNIRILKDTIGDE